MNALHNHHRSNSLTVTKQANLVMIARQHSHYVLSTAHVVGYVGSCDTHVMKARV